MTSKTALFPPVDPLPPSGLIHSPLFAAEHYAVKSRARYKRRKCEMASLFVPISSPGRRWEISRSPPAHSLQQNWLEHEFRIPGRRRGYVVVIQDVRGRYASEGDWYPFIHEAEDGYDTVEWVAALPYSDGKVACSAASYVGAYSDARRHGSSSASRRYLSRGYRQQLSRRLDLPGRRL